MTKLPNIVIFNPDQWRGDVLGHMGNQAAVTPNLDRFVQTEAVSFRHAYCQNPVCTPSRCSFMSGWYPHVRGHRTMYHMLRPDEPMLLKTLKDAGYFVWWGGKNDVVPAENGFGAYCHVKYKPTEPANPLFGLDSAGNWRGKPGDDTYYSFYAGKIKKGRDRDYYYDYDWAHVLGAIEQIKNAPENQPLCIYLPLVYPHPPYAVEEPWYTITDRTKLPARTPAPNSWVDKPSMLKGLYERQNMQSWSEERWDDLRATYYGMCSRVDYQFGLVMDALREAGIYDDTAVFFFSDHGDFTGDYGLVEKTQNTFEDCLTRVPLLVKPPAWIPVNPRISHAMVELIDVSATIEELTGITTKHTHFGRTLLPLITGETEEHRDAVFCEGGRLPGESHCMELEGNPTRSTESLYWPRQSLQSGEGLEHTKAVMCRTKDFKYVHRLFESDELYDLRNDPVELNNRINDPELANVLTLLKDRLLRFYVETCDVVPHDLNDRGFE